MTRRFLMVALLLVGCSDSPASSTAAVDATAADVVISVVFAEGLVTGAEPIVEVDLGDTVRIEIVSDTPDEIHIHGGYDLYVGVPRAQDVAFSFVADRLGVFAVELEGLGYVLFEIDVG